MKQLLTCFLLLCLSQLPEASDNWPSLPQGSDSSTHLFIITIDGFRWQELFGGADENIISNELFTPDMATSKMMYWANTPVERRKKLMPFMWNVIAQKGQLYGNRLYDNNVDVANIYAVSYPGYNELFTGKTDLTIANNNKVYNPNKNVFEYLESKESFKGSVAIFTSWNVFPFILNKQRNDLEMNCGYKNVDEATTPGQVALNRIQDEAAHKPGTRQDMLTFIAAKEYLQQHRPKILYLGLGETDEYAHAGNYDAYLQKANETDHIIAELWHWAQTTPGYKDNTTFLITTDHGRGLKNKWTSHGPFIRGSSHTWMALLGKNIEPFGEVKNSGQLFQKQFAQTIAYLLGEHFGAQRPMVQMMAVK